MKRLVILGASGHGRVAADIAGKNGYDSIAFLDDTKKTCGRYPVMGESARFSEYDCDFFVAIGNPQVRRRMQETGLTLTSWQCRGVVTFLNDTCEGEYMYLFTADCFEGKMTQCDEGDLQWVEREFLNALPKWEGDQIFLDLLWQNAPFFLLTLRYHGDTLVEAILNGEKIR